MKLHFLVVTLIFSCIACVFDTSSEFLSGDWTIHKAMRNNRETTILNGGQFQFESDSTVSTNIYGVLKQYRYTYEAKAKKLNIRFENPQEFKLEKLANDTILLSGKVQKYFMQIYLTKSNYDSAVVQ